MNVRNGMSTSEAGKLGWIKSRKSVEERYRKIRLNYENNPKLCKECGKKIPYQKRWNDFCDSHCSASYNNRGKVKNPFGIGLRNVSNSDISCKPHKKIRRAEVILCRNCGKEFKPKTRHSMFCSLACSSNFRHNKRMSEIENFVEATGEFPKGTGTTNFGEAHRKQVRFFLEQHFGHRCSICGNTEWMGKPIPLVVDHIDGNPLNCKVENFRLVCGNCDMQLDTYKGKNKGHGRAWRKKYRN